MNTTVEEATGRMLDILNDGAIALLTGLGYQTGLFDTLAKLPAARSELIADAAGLSERYVREWLGGMVTAGLLRYDPDGGTYLLREEYRPVLSGQGPENLAPTIQYLPLLAQAVPKIERAFRNGGGTGYGDYPGFHQLMAANSAVVNDAALLEAIIPLSGRTESLRTGISVADIGCGEGHALNLLAGAYPASDFTGYDFSAEALEAATAEAERRGLANVHFELLDVADLEDTERFDFITAFDAIHDQADPARVLRNIRAALRPGGTFLMVDINASSRLEDNSAIPWGSFLYAISTFHCMAVSLGQGGAGLGAVWGRQLALSMLREAGFGDVVVHELEDDPFNAYYVARQ
ncbi:class I SAM-dependent methyltransferase [Arthrobacter cupressi]|uniref:Methyltransferase domain-containing protein n=1 Tax=Arthrobacter cupressi TaxID=1045773 RepID=A0A1G8VG76_9MICC|nr:class I SAM-dependent methyltransferase [Arthrobacter cupressi]NYD79446.1 2-polyprenyl-3-methyl-5-hydroxy-6-metoxy-1,4-benzoquinol methylase [Arthrobacter cupressi]SDJ65116.1 Methyltransferase domain-containing protein [Arthrobacter cupressi]